MSAFRQMADDAKELVTMQVGQIGDRALVPMVHAKLNRSVHGFGAVDDDLATTATGVVRLFGPDIVALTFHGQRGRLDGFFEHEVATVVVIDRERIEVWEARLVRHDGTASLGAWRPWPVDAAAGKLTTPIQEAMR